MVSNGSPNAHPGPLPVSSTLPLVQCLPREPSGLGGVLGGPDKGEEAVGSERTRARSHVGASLLPRPRRRVVVVGRRIRDVRMTASSPQQEAEECRQTSSVSHWISSLSRASPVGRQAPETGGAGNRVAICQRRACASRRSAARGGNRRHTLQRTGRRAPRGCRPAGHLATRGRLRSNAPMSHVAMPSASPSCGRATPRWSVVSHALPPLPGVADSRRLWPGYREGAHAFR